MINSDSRYACLRVNVQHSRDLAVNVDNIKRAIIVIYVINVVIDPVHCKAWDKSGIQKLAGDMICAVIPGKYHESIIAITTFLSKYGNYNSIPQTLSLQNNFYKDIVL